MKKYTKVKGQDFKIQVNYSKGGMNFITNQEEKRGYTLVVTPVKREQRDGYTVERTSVYSGYKMFLLEVGRKSKKSLEKAIDMAAKQEDKLIQNILIREGI